MARNEPGAAPAAPDATVQTCRVCMVKTADGDLVPCLDGFLWYCRRCVAERTRVLNARAERIRRG